MKKKHIWLAIAILLLGSVALDFFLLKGSFDEKYVIDLTNKEIDYITDFNEVYFDETLSTTEKVTAYEDLLQDFRATSYRNRSADQKAFVYRELIKAITKSGDEKIGDYGDELIELYPLDFQSYQTVGDYYFDREDYVKAAEYYEAAFNRNVMSDYLFLHLVESLEKSENEVKLKSVMEVMASLYYPDTATFNFLAPNEDEEVEFSQLPFSESYRRNVASSGVEVTFWLDQKAALQERSDIQKLEISFTVFRNFKSAISDIEFGMKDETVEHPDYSIEDEKATVDMTPYNIKELSYIKIHIQFLDFFNEGNDEDSE